MKILEENWAIKKEESVSSKTPIQNDISKKGNIKTLEEIKNAKKRKIK